MLTKIQIFSSTTLCIIALNSHALQPLPQKQDIPSRKPDTSSSAPIPEDSASFNLLHFPEYKIQIGEPFDEFDFTTKSGDFFEKSNPLFNIHNPNLIIPAPISFNSKNLNFEDTVQDAVFLGALFALARPCTIAPNEKIQQHIATQLSGTLYENSDLHQFSLVLKKYNQSYQQNFLKFTEAPKQDQQFSCLMAKAYWKSFAQTPTLATTSFGTTTMQALTFSSALVAGKNTSCTIQKKDQSQINSAKEQLNLVEQNTLILSIASLNAQDLYEVEQLQKTWLQGFDKGISLEAPQPDADTLQTITLINESKDLEQLKNINHLSCSDASRISKAIYSAVVEQKKILLQKIKTLKKQRTENLGTTT